MNISELFELEGMNRDMASEYTQNEKEYVKFLRLFRTDIDNSKKIINDYIVSGDLDNYTRAVHSLKSNSRIVGAAGISAFAAELESLGKVGDWVSICSKTPELLMRLDELNARLEPFVKEEAAEPPKKQHLESEALSELYELLLWAVRELDADSAKVALDKIAECELPNKAQELFPQLQKAVEDMEYEAAEKLIVDCIS